MTPANPQLLAHGTPRAMALACALAAAFVLGSCARTGRLEHVTETVAPVEPDSTKPPQEPQPPQGLARAPFRKLFGDTVIGFVPGTADTSRRFLGRLRDGYTADTLNIFLCGDNRPGWRSSSFRTDLLKVRDMVSINPVRILRGLVALPVVLVKGFYPDLALVRDLPGVVKGQPNFGREHQVRDAMLAKLDSLEARGQVVAAIINTGDVVKDGRYPAQWERFLELIHPLSSQVPYFPIAGNHERTDDIDGLENWRAGTGLPITGDRLYYCFDSADGWVRFIALDSNPMTDPANHWTREVEVAYSDEQIDWMVASLKNHIGPAFIFMHHPPFSTGFHRVEWQSDEVLRERRERMVRALHETGISVIASGHEHAYERALLTWPDAVLINIVTGGAGSPLHEIPPPAEGARLFSEYKVAGSVVTPENVLTGSFFHFIHVRLWYGGGEFFTYAVEKDGSTELVDKVEIDLKRFGIPEIDQQKMPLPPKGPEQPPPPEEGKDKEKATADSDSVSASERIEAAEPPPIKKEQ